MLHFCAGECSTMKGMKNMKNKKRHALHDLHGQIQFGSGLARLPMELL
jgi:hypothetical protein